jgi:hypothetical protein
VRTPLPHDVAAGESVALQAQIQAPPAQGSYTLRWDLFEEGNGWFAARGATPLDVAVSVQPAGAPAVRLIASASDNPADAAKAVDGNPATAWSSIDTQQPGMWFMVDLGAVQQVNGVTMVSPDKDFPRGYFIEISTDGAAWSEVTRKDPNWKSVDVMFSPVRARFVRITQTRVPRWPVAWSISEVSLSTATLWSATASPNPSDASKAIDGNPQTAWTTGAPQQPGAYFQLDLGEKVTIDRLKLNNTGNPQYPRGYVVRVSLDGQTWTEAARKGSNWAPVDVVIAPRIVRYLRIENTGSSKWHPWTIAEVSVETAPAS